MACAASGHHTPLMAELTIIEAIRAAILNEMEEDERVMILGLSLIHI